MWRRCSVIKLWRDRTKRLKFPDTVKHTCTGYKKQEYIEAAPSSNIRPRCRRHLLKLFLFLARIWLQLHFVLDSICEENEMRENLNKEEKAVNVSKERNT